MTCILCHHPPRQAEHGRLCRHHRGQLDTHTGEITTLWCELNLVLDGALPRPQREQTRHNKAAEAPAPADLDALSLRDPRSGPAGDRLPAVPAVIASWVLLLAEERPLTAVLPKGVVAQLGLLARHHDWIAAQDWVDDYAAELADLRRALQRTVHDDSPPARLGACPALDDDGTCGRPLRQTHPGAMAVACPAGHAYDEHLLRHLGGMLDTSGGAVLAEPPPGPA